MSYFDISKYEVTKN